MWSSQSSRKSTIRSVCCFSPSDGSFPVYLISAVTNLQFMKTPRRKVFSINQLRRCQRFMPALKRYALTVSKFTLGANCKIAAKNIPCAGGIVRREQLHRGLSRVQWWRVNKMRMQIVKKVSPSLTNTQTASRAPESRSHKLDWWINKMNVRALFMFIGTQSGCANNFVFIYRPRWHTFVYSQLNYIPSRRSVGKYSFPVLRKKFHPIAK